MLSHIVAAAATAAAVAAIVIGIKTFKNSKLNTDSNEYIILY